MYYVYMYMRIAYVLCACWWQWSYGQVDEEDALGCTCAMAGAVDSDGALHESGKAPGSGKTPCGWRQRIRQISLIYEHKEYTVCIEEIYGVLSLSMEFYLCLWSSIFVCGCWVHVYGNVWVHVCGCWVHLWQRLIACLTVGSLPDSR